ncbi:MAG TPA: FHA domain-containing protein [Thermoanaerobaculia bacterium]|nr:FHA domain-containing protein [Thermoanaerobaculia bacterium]
MAERDGWFLDFGSRRVALPPGEVVVGRSRGTEVQVRDATVSRNHAILHVEADRLTVRDLGSSNGTFVNHERVDSEVPVRAGDVVRFGRVSASADRGPAASLAGGLRFCPACGIQVSREADVCPRCGESFRHERPMSRSEAISVSDVMPVGEALAAPSLSLEDTLPPRRAGRLWDRRPDDAAADEEPPAEWAGERALAGAAPETADETRIGPDPATGGGTTAEEPPPAAAAPSGRLYLPAAGFLPRAAAFLIDLAGPLAAGLIAAWLAGGSSRSTGWIAGAAVAAGSWAVLCVAGWSRTGATPGKAALSLAVCDLDGRPGIGAGRALGRWTGYFLSAAPAGLGFLVVGLSAGRRAFHDRLTGTYVGRLEPTTGGGRSREPAAGTVSSP